MLDDDVQMAARTHVAVLVTASRRAERERCARLIHAKSNNGHGPFVPLAIGSAHDADESGLRPRFVQARGGTLFVDDIAALSTSAQAELLALLGERLPRASVGPRESNEAVRIISGASCCLDRARATGAFSESLFYRLNVIHIDLIDHQRSKESR
jgi:two-component system response regulator HydG